MSVQFETRLISYKVSKCPRCEQEHEFQLEVRRKVRGVPLFGAGPSSPKETAISADTGAVKPTNWDVVFTCPVTKEQFVESISPISQKGEEILGVQVSSTLQPAPSSMSSTLDNLLEIELQEWVKSSTKTARDFCITMVVTAIGAIPVFFAVLKYLGVEKANNILLSWLGIVPSSLFLASAVIFILALRPQYSIVFDVTSFSDFRTRRFQQLNQFIRIGTGLFVASVCVAILIFVITIID